MQDNTINKLSSLFILSCSVLIVSAFVFYGLPCSTGWLASISFAETIRIRNEQDMNGQQEEEKIMNVIVFIILY